jgi:hypothetical protein
MQRKGLGKECVSSRDDETTHLEHSQDSSVTGKLWVFPIVTHTAAV